MFRSIARKRLAEDFILAGNRTSATVLVVGLVALKIAALFFFAWHSRFVMDEFQQLGFAKYLGHGLFDTIWHPKAVGYVLFYKLAHLVGWDAVSILLVGRVQTALLGCATLAIIYACARALGHDRLRSLVILLVLLSFSNFIERIFRTIAEPLAVFFAAAALLVVLRGRADQARTVLIAGLFSGLSFLATQKAVYFNLALGLGLVADAVLARRVGDGLKRGAWLVAGWLLPIVAYCFLFGGIDPVPVARNLFLGPVEVATTGGDPYGNLGKYVVQTLARNALLYAFCFAGMGLALLRIKLLDERRRIALVFALVITALVFAHNQPWPYVFLMALPFMALWATEPFDALAARPLYRAALWAVLAIAIAASFARNITYLGIDNRGQLALVDRAEALVAPGEIYFDGVGMLPNRREPSTLWLDRGTIFKTLRKKQASEAYRILADSPPKIILWSYRMEAIKPVVGALIRDRYVQVAPHIRLAGRRLAAGERAAFDVPIAGNYGLYDLTGAPLRGRVEVDGRPRDTPVRLVTGRKTVRLLSGPRDALLLPVGAYDGLFAPGGDDQQLFAHVYD
jgi:hypothetical protein